MLQLIRHDIELDDETGNYCSCIRRLSDLRSDGEKCIRYYDPKFSFWLSVDPLAEKTMEAYVYASNNPIKQ